MAEEGKARPMPPEHDEAGDTQERAAGAGQQEDPWRLDQIGAIVGKGLDLVEVGIQLGIKLANRVSSSLQLQLENTTDDAAAPYPGPQGGSYPGPQGGSYPGPQGAPYPGSQGTPYPSPQGTPHAGEAMGPLPQQPPRQQEAPPQLGFVVNRTELFPGDPVSVSFTINNDSPSAPKELTLRVEGFVGHVHGARFDGGSFAVEPATKVIAPMDFDKFTLRGAIPGDAIGDAYGGWIVVSGEEDLQIPVRLVVSTQP